MVRFGVVACVLVALLPGFGRAQAPATREHLERFRAGMLAAEDTLALLERERKLIDLARVNRDSTVLHLELGFLAQRLGDLTGSRSHYDDAASEFEWATELEPAWPYAWYGLGVAELSLGEHEIIAVENIRQILGKDFLSKATGAFARAARADPAFAVAVIDLAYTAMRQRVKPRLDVARDALREAAATDAAASAALQLARGRVERESGEADSALAAFRRYLALAGDSGVGLLETARTLFYQRRPGEASRAYYEGAAAARSAEARALYRADLAWIATSDELTGLDAHTGPAYQDALRRFWESRDVQDGRRRGERVAEHYRRYFHALRNYRLVSRHRHYDITEPYRSDQELLDDRGIIYLRHGEPDRRATYHSPAVEPNESWQYVSHDGTSRIFHFVARDDVSDYKLVESLADAYGARLAITAAATGNAAFTAGLFESRSEMDPLYQRLGGTASYSNRGPALAEERARGKEAIRNGTTTDSYEIEFRRDLNPVVLPLIVGGARSGEGRLLLPFAVSGRALTPFAAGGSTVYPLGIRVLLHGPAGPVMALDTTRVFSAGRPLTDDEQLNGLVEVPVSPGTYRLRVVLMQDEAGTGAVIARDSVVIPAFDGRAVTVSDIVAGIRGEGPRWPAGGDSIPVSATLRFPRGASLDLYFEVHGLAAGEPFRTRVEVEGTRRGGLFGLFGGRRTLRLEFEGSADGPVTRIRQTVNLGSLEAGGYTLRVTALARGDEHHARAVSLSLVDPR